MRLLRPATRHGSGRSRAGLQRCACCAAMPHQLPTPATTSTSSTIAQRLREGLPNARDLHEAFPAIPPGRLIRCANPSSAPPEVADWLLRELRVRDLIDLRAGEEIQEDDPGSALMRATAMRIYRRGWLTRGQLYVQPDPLAAVATGPPPPPATSDSPPDAAAAPSASKHAVDASVEGNGTPETGPVTSTVLSPALATLTEAAAAALTDPSDPPAPSSPSQPTAAAAAITPTTTTTASDAAPATSNSNPTSVSASTITSAVRHHISLLDRGRYYLSLASRLPASVTLSALLTNLLLSKPAARAMLLPYVNGGGLPMLYEMLLESSRPELRQVLEVLLSAAESRHCVMFFCRAGKDRTGLVAAAVLAVAGASEEQIVQDYARSDAYHRVALAGLEGREELAGLDRSQFERAPREVMEATLDYLRRRYGSFSGYLTSIGFGPERQQRLRELLTSEW
ncbi:hypothetical protein Agub_g1981 [Astrephomene gubernaculifera]|uniref:Tyrosine specific protein phosphatases domain-containing protein n=1 Tax=Astrephomene gubernaculifera TaxID=47775 RepID=A0AAD3DGC8_9CHLO|nr:hypothetical protein Agub_g1981 [Astrephomene gubernaculifera]